MEQKRVKHIKLFTFLLISLVVFLMFGLTSAYAQGEPTTHTVQRGETLSRIAQQYGVTWQNLALANNLSNPNLIHSGLVLQINGTSTTSTSDQNSQTTTMVSTDPTGEGQRIVVSLSQQHLWAYDNGNKMVSTPVTTGRPGAATATGNYTVLRKYSPYQFVSFYQPGHPFYYAPVWANYSLRYTWTGYHIHDAPWRASFGPGTNVGHYDANGQWTTGSFGCINVPTPAMEQLYSWASPGVSVVVQH